MSKLPSPYRTMDNDDLRSLIEPMGWYQLDEIGWFDTDFSPRDPRDIPDMLGRCEQYLNEIYGSLDGDEFDHPADIDLCIRLSYTCHVLADRLAETDPDHPHLSTYAVFRSH